MSTCVKCRRSFSMMFVSVILGVKSCVCWAFPSCNVIQRRMALVDALTK